MKWGRGEEQDRGHDDWCQSRTVDRDMQGTRQPFGTFKAALESPMEVMTGNKPGRNIQRSGILIKHLQQLAKLLGFPQMLGCFVFCQPFTKNTEKEGF